MESVGQELRVERLRAGLTLEQVSARTRISIKNLQAIENDDLQRIRSPFFYKSFVRQFAEYLNLDFVRLASAVQNAASTMPQPLIPGQVLPGQGGADLPKIPAIPVRRPKNFRWLSSIASLGVVLVGCSTLYAIWQNARVNWNASVPRLVQSVKPKPKVSQPPTKQAVVSHVTSTQKPVVRQIQAAVLHPSVPDADPNATAQPDLTAQAQPNSPSELTSQSQQSNEAPDSETAFRVELSALEPTWLSIVEDGKETFSGTLEAAESKVLEGHETARIRTGNAGGLSLVFNGRAIGTVGPRGQVRTVVFTKENYEVLEPSAHISLTHFNSGLE